MAEIQTYPDGTPVAGDKVPFVEDPDGAAALKLAPWSAFGGGGGGGGGAVLASASVNNATQQNPGGAGGPTPVDAALTVTFAAPASGRVTVMLQAAAYGNPGDSGTHWLLTAAGTPVANTSKFITALGVGNLMAYSVLIPVTVTPAASYTWAWAAKGSHASGGYATTYGGIYGAAVMMVFAA